MIGWPLALKWAVLWASCDSQHPTCPHTVQTRRLKSLWQPSHVCERGAAILSVTWGHSAFVVASIGLHPLSAPLRPPVGTRSLELEGHSVAAPAPPPALRPAPRCRA